MESIERRLVGVRDGLKPFPSFSRNKLHFQSSVDGRSAHVGQIPSSFTPFPAASLPIGMAATSFTSVEEAKSAGNVSFGAQRYEEALGCYSSAIALSHPNPAPALFTNRAMVLHLLKRYEEELADAEKAIACDPKWAKVLRSAPSSLLHALLHAGIEFHIVGLLSSVRSSEGSGKRPRSSLFPREMRRFGRFPSSEEAARQGPFFSYRFASSPRSL